MKILKKYNIGDIIPYTFNGVKKYGKLRYCFHPSQYEIDELFEEITVDDLLYVIETSEKDEDGVIIDDIVVEWNIL